MAGGIKNDEFGEKRVITNEHRENYATLAYAMSRGDTAIVSAKKKGSEKGVVLVVLKSMDRQGRTLFIPIAELVEAPVYDLTKDIAFIPQEATKGYESVRFIDVTNEEAAAEDIGSDGQGA